MGQTFVSKLFLLIILVISIIAGVYYGAQLFIIWLPFVFAWWIGGFLGPIVQRVHLKTKVNHTLLTFIFLLLFIGLFFGILSILAYIITQQVQNLLFRFPEIEDWFREGNFSINENLIRLIQFLPDSLRLGLEESIPEIISQINMSLTTMLASIIGILAIVPNLLIATIVMFVAAFFITKDQDKLKSLEMKVYSHKCFRNPLFKTFKEDVWMVFIGYVKAQLILMTITFTEVSMGLLILKIPYAILIALGIGFLDALPVFGTGAVFIPWIIIVIFYKEYGLALGLFILYLVATLTRQSLEPKIISTQIGIHPLITLLTIYTGIKVFGVLGIIIAPLIGISILAVKKSGILRLEN